MIDQQKAIEIAIGRLPRKYETPVLLRAVRSDSLEEFGDDVSGWRIWFRLKDQDFGTYDRPVEVSDSTEEAKLVKIML